MFESSDCVTNTFLTLRSPQVKYPLLFPETLPGEDAKRGEGHATLTRGEIEIQGAFEDDGDDADDEDDETDKVLTDKG